MKTVTSAEMRMLDRAAMDEYEIPGEELMRRAGTDVGHLVLHIIERCGFHHPLIQLIAGRGNNGGDAFVAALFLHKEDCDVEVLLAGSAAEIRGDALRHFGSMRSAGVRLRELPTMEDWEEEIEAGEHADVIVDGVLGIGVKGPPRGPVAGAIRHINAAAGDALVIAIDIPSGLDADTGVTPGDAVRADITATIGLPKPGLLVPAALEFVGTVEVIDIGIPTELLSSIATDPELIAAADMRGLFPRRRRRAHKGDFGHALIVAGAPGFGGAAIMSGRAAARSGAGLVSMAIPAPVASDIVAAVPEAMVHPVPATAGGAIAGDALRAWPGTLDAFTAVVAGPGLTPGAETGAVVRHLLRECRAPLVLDADALNVLAGKIGSLKDAVGPVAITPHPGELARLLGVAAPDITADPHGAARRAAELSGAVVILKGAGTVVAKAGRPLMVNMTGNPGMATGGTGDVLAGLLGGLLAQGIPVFEAACAAVYLHGSAGDAAAWRKTQAGITALDLIDELPYVFRTVSIR